jgi:tetratricopeptide (TPR) repeat protein
MIANPSKLGDLFAQILFPEDSPIAQIFPRLDTLLACRRAKMPRPAPDERSTPEMGIADAGQFAWDQYCGLGAFQISARRLVDLWLELQDIVQPGQALPPTWKGKRLILELVENHWGSVVEEDPRLAAEIRDRLKKGKLLACEVGEPVDTVALWDLEVGSTTTYADATAPNQTAPSAFRPRLRIAAPSAGSGVPRLSLRASEDPDTDAAPVTSCAYVLMHDVTQICAKDVRSKSGFHRLSASIPVHLVWRGESGKQHAIAWPLPPVATFAETTLFLKNIRTRSESILASRVPPNSAIIDTSLLARLVREWIVLGIDAIEGVPPSDESSQSWAGAAGRIQRLREEAEKDRDSWRLEQIDEWLRKVTLLAMPEACSPDVSALILAEVEQSVVDSAEKLRTSREDNAGRLQALRELQLKSISDEQDWRLFGELNKSPKADSWLFVPVQQRAPESESGLNSQMRSLRWETLRSQFQSLLTRGDLEAQSSPSEALKTLIQAREIAKTLADELPADTQARSDLAVACDRLGHVWTRLKRFPEALETYRQVVDIDLGLATASPDNLPARRDLAAAHRNVGDICLELKRRAEAEEAYRRSLEICRDLGRIYKHTERMQEAMGVFTQEFEVTECLARLNLEDRQLQRDLASSCMNLGQVSLRLDHLDKARELFRQALEIRQRLARASPDDIEAQLEESSAHIDVGDASFRRDRLIEAREAYRQALKLSQRVANSHPDAISAKRSLSVAYDRVVKVSLALNEIGEALKAQTLALEIDEFLAKADPDSSRAQRNLFISYRKLGEVLLRLPNKLSDAQDAYDRAFAIAEDRALRHPDDILAQYYLSAAHCDRGDVLMRLKRYEKAYDAYLAALAIDEGRARDLGDNEAHRNLSVVQAKLAKACSKLARLEEALERQLQALQIDQRLASQSPGDRRDLAESYVALGDIHMLRAKPADAEKAYREALQIREQRARDNQEDANAQIELAVVLAKSADLVENQSQKQSLQKRAWLILQNERRPDAPFEPETEEIYAKLRDTLDAKPRGKAKRGFEPYQWGSDADDPNYEMFGHRPKAQGFELRVVGVDWDDESFWFNAVVQKSAADGDVWGPVRFALHPDFPSPIITIRKLRKIERGRQIVIEAKLDEVIAEEAFTIVAEIMRAKGNPLKLGFDLHRINGLPQRFKWRR